jgi:uncharacterized membrane protein YccC
MTTTWRAHLAVALVAATVLVVATLPRSGGASIGVGLLGLVVIAVAVAISVKVLDDRSAPRLARIEAAVVLGLVTAAMLLVFVGAPLFERIG